MDNLKELQSTLDSSAGGVSDDEDRLIIALDFGTTFSGQVNFNLKTHDILG